MGSQRSAAAVSSAVVELASELDGEAIALAMAALAASAMKASSGGITWAPSAM